MQIIVVVEPRILITDSESPLSDWEGIDRRCFQEPTIGFHEISVIRYDVIQCDDTGL